MPVANRAQARDQILAIVQTVANAVTPNPLNVIYDDTREDKPRDDSTWARASIRHASGNTVTLAGAHGRTRKRYLGILTVQIFTSSSDGLVESDALAQSFLEAFTEGTSIDGVIFRGATANEVEHDGPWQQVNVIINFEYDNFQNATLA